VGVFASPLLARGRPAHYAVIDLETTGLDADASAIVECAIVELDAAGVVRDEWSSLVRIEGHVGASEIHHIAEPMLRGAPSFSDLLPDIVDRLRGRVVVGHVVGFDLAHLAAEFRRAGRRLPDLRRASLCTRAIAESAGLERPRTLLGCCRATGVAHRGAHTALGDARSTAALLRHFLAKGAVRGRRRLARRAARLDW